MLVWVHYAGALIKRVVMLPLHTVDKQDMADAYCNVETCGFNSDIAIFPAVSVVDFYGMGMSPRTARLHMQSFL